MLTVTNGVFEEVWDKFLSYDELPDKVKIRFPCNIRCALVKACSPIHERFNFVRDMGMTLIHKILYGELLESKHLTLIFPERWMSIQEQNIFISMLLRHPEINNIETVNLMTSSPLLVGNFYKEQVKIIMFPEDEEKLQVIDDLYGKIISWIKI